MAHSTHNRLERLLLFFAFIFSFPLACAAASFNYAAAILTPQNNLRRRLRRTPQFKSKTVVITGISTATGLRVARALWQTGHNVIGADVSTSILFNPARFSRAVKKVCKLRPPYGNHGALNYIQDLIQVIEKEKADMWIDCTTSIPTQAIAQSKRLVQRRTACHCIAADMETMDHFKTSKQLHNFARSRGLPSPEIHVVKSRDEIHAVLNQGQGKKRYLLQAPDGSNATNPRTLLPRRSLSQTYQDVSKIKIVTPLCLEEDIADKTKYQVCGIVAQGKLRAFAAGLESDMGCKSLPTASGLAQAMANFVDSLAGQLGEEFSSHVSVTFCVDERVTHSGVVQQITPLEGRLAASQELLLFSGKEDSVHLAHAYLSSLLAPTANGLVSHNGSSKPDLEVFGQPISNNEGVYAFDEDMMNLWLRPVIRVLTFQSSVTSLAQFWTTFVRHVFFWQEATYTFWDPLPVFWGYFVSLPLRLIFRS